MMNGGMEMFEGYYLDEILVETQSLKGKEEALVSIIESFVGECFDDRESYLQYLKEEISKYEFIVLTTTDDIQLSDPTVEEEELEAFLNQFVALDLDFEAKVEENYGLETYYYTYINKDGQLTFLNRGDSTSELSIDPTIIKDILNNTELSNDQKLMAIQEKINLALGI